MKHLKIGKGLHESSGLQALLAILWDNQLEEESEEPQQKMQQQEKQQQQPEEDVQEEACGRDEPGEDMERESGDQW